MKQAPKKWILAKKANLPTFCPLDPSSDRWTNEIIVIQKNKQADKITDI